jgi:hypothetical protein
VDDVDRRAPSVQGRQRTAVARHRQFQYQKALCGAKWAFPRSTGSEHDAMVVHLVAMAGIGELDADEADMRNSRDILSELGDEQHMRPKMALDCQDKTTSTLNDVPKKMSDTASGNIQNLS